MIDIHTHILPGIDDGPKTMEDSIALAKQAEAEGIHTMVATPHHQNGAFTNNGEDIRALVHYFNQVLKDNNVDLTVLSGQEIRMYGELLDDLNQGTAISVNDSRYVLVELSSVQVPRYTSQLFYDMQINGYVPVIVHPERNQTFKEKPEELYQLVKNGALTQVTAHCFTNRMNKKTRQFAEQLVTHNMAHIISSDAHNTDKRTFDLAFAYHRIEKKLGFDYLYILKENAERIITNQNVIIDPPERIKKKKFLGMF
ncbi:tyrosine-protein phosphatase [Alteribacillus bidgolensis]|uniref:Tyrosine-protein phosphatase n=1 Tax=Alteribacillus bidgolensis TaxID=930129 RepID=A0A1G8PPX8_9BACI|nr:CpsB/CapC family capsule biosynthesis tyrosine phosphatase [Alteribacillus bidgolensis]SDI94398.1 protein-tyrosine phosphatase [Alteribacillus bidgolensis]